MNLRDAGLPASAVVAALGLLPHPEGGWYRELWRDLPPGGGRGAGTAIHYLLAAGESSHWHLVDAAEAWHWYAGSALLLRMAGPGGERREVRLGPDFGAGEATFALVPAGWWQVAAPLGEWVLVGCTVCPAFEFAGFEMAPKGWEPG